jgi:hypothetical protein
MAEVATYYGYRDSRGKVVGLARIRRDDESRTMVSERMAPGGDWVDAPELIADLMQTDRPHEIGEVVRALVAHELANI